MQTASMSARVHTVKADRDSTRAAGTYLRQRQRTQQVPCLKRYTQS